MSDIVPPDLAFCTAEPDTEGGMPVTRDKDTRHLPVIDVDPTRGGHRQASESRKALPHSLPHPSPAAP